MITGLEKKSETLQFNLSEAQYVSSLLQEASRQNLLSVTELEQIQVELLKLLKHQVRRYTGGESSSVKTETALNIMQSVLYSVGVYLKSLPDAGESISMLKNTKFEELYQKSRPMVKKMVMDSKLLLKAVQKNHIGVELYAYRDTIGNALPDFFRNYDMEFLAHETMASIDYPLCVDRMDKVGIEYVNLYLKKLYYENLFCGKYPAEDIQRLLKSYDRNYRDLLINIFQMVLVNALGSVLLNKSAFLINLTGADKKELMQKYGRLSKSEMEAALKKAAGRLLTELDLKSGFLDGYVLDAVKEISARLYNALANNRPDSVFVEFLEEEPENEIRFIDSGRMDDESFRKLADEIRDLELVSDKIAVIKREIRSFFDLSDLLEADCIFDDEFIEVFRSLDEMQLALMMKKMPANPFDADAAASENGEEWQGKFISFLNALNKDQVQKITEISGMIKI